MSKRFNLLKTKLGGLAASVVVRKWMSTLDYQVAMYDHKVDPVSPDYDGTQVILVFWHEYLLAPFYLRGRSHTAILTSRHRDAEGRRQRRAMNRRRVHSARCMEPWQHCLRLRRSALANVELVTISIR